MNKLKPEDVMRALECCVKGKCIEDKCPLFDWDEIDDTNVCITKLCEKALALLREKDAEIERLTKELDGQFEKWKILSEKTEKLYADLYQDAKQVVRAEAITEFAERLKAKMDYVARWQMHGCEDEYFIIGKPFIDETAKEMKGEKG